MTERHPTAFILDKDDNIAAPRGKSRTRAEIEFEVEPEPEFQAPAQLPFPMPHRFPWLGWLVTGVFALVSLYAGLAITDLVESAFARNPMLGWLALAATALVAIAALAIIAREIWGIFSLRHIAELQHNATRALTLDESAAANAATSALTQLYSGRPDMAPRLQAFAADTRNIMDPSDRIKLADRILISPLDEQVHRIVASRARRVTLLTTVTPAAALDILFVASQNLMMLREIASLYGGRPSTLSTLRLARMVVAHLAVSGGLALSDNLIQHLVGKGLLGRLSARFGEGAVNGILTCRVGLAAADVCRPIPPQTPNRETLARLLKQLVSFAPKDKDSA